MADYQKRIGTIPVESSVLVTRDTTLVGSGAATDPLGVADTGPDNPTPAFNPTTTIYYARTTGSDETGEGSETSPYRTFQRAIRNVPPMVLAAQQYIIDITGLGEEVLPVTYALPAFVAASGNLPISTLPDAPFYWNMLPVIVRALPQLVQSIPAAQAVITAADSATVTTDANSGLCSILVDAPRASWASGALKGKKVIRTVGSVGNPAYNTTCCIQDSDTTSIYLANDATSVNGGTGALVLASGEQIQIVEESAILSAPPWPAAADPLGDFGTAISCNTPVQFQGISFQLSDRSFGVALGISASSALLNFQLCDIAGIEALTTGQSEMWMWGVTMSNLFITAACAPDLYNCYFSGLFAMVPTSPDCLWKNVVFEDSAPVGNQPGLFAAPFNLQVGWTNGIIRNAVTDSIALHWGGIYAENITITTNDGGATPGDSIRADGGLAYLELTNVNGTSQRTGAGIHLDDGAQCRLKGTLNAATAAGGALLVGSLPVRSWSDFNTNVPTYNQYDLQTPFTTNVASGNATPQGTEGEPCTGSRLFRRD